MECPTYWVFATERVNPDVQSTTRDAQKTSQEEMTMSKFGSMCLAAAVLGAAGGALAADGPKGQVIPDFAPTANTGWVLDRSIGVDDLLPPPTGGPGPVTYDRAHPYVPNGNNRQSTYRVADLTNPILQPWPIPSMKKANDEVLAGKVPFRARERCWPVGVPGYSAYSLVEPFFFYQTGRQGRGHQPGRAGDPAHLSQRFPFQGREAVLVRRIGRPLRERRYAGHRYHRSVAKILYGQLPHARTPTKSMWWSAGSSPPTPRRWT